MNQEILIKWSSVLGRSYAVDWSPDLEDWFELDDGIEGEADETSFIDDTILPGTFQRTYRVRELE